MPKHIGIVACSAEGASLCYRTICIEGENYLGKRYAHPEVTMHGFSFEEYMHYIENDDWEKVADMMIKSAEKVAKTGAEFAICPDNTIHRAFKMVVEKSPIPWLHIADEVAKVARERGFKCVGILGTKYLMESEVYPEYFKKYGISYKIPDKEDRILINSIIFDELVYGVFKDESRKKFYEIIQKLKDSGCDAVVLGCTEIPLLVREEESPLPTLDSTRILARAALKEAVKS